MRPGSTKSHAPRCCKTTACRAHGASRFIPVLSARLASVPVLGRAGQRAKLPPRMCEPWVGWLLRLEPGNPHPESRHHQPASGPLPRDPVSSRTPLPAVPLLHRPPSLGEGGEECPHQRPSYPARGRCCGPSAESACPGRARRRCGCAEARAWTPVLDETSAPDGSLATARRRWMRWMPRGPSRGVGLAVPLFGFTPAHRWSSSSRTWSTGGSQRPCWTATRSGGPVGSGSEWWGECGVYRLLMSVKRLFSMTYGREVAERVAAPARRRAARRTRVQQAREANPRPERGSSRRRVRAHRERQGRRDRSRTRPRTTSHRTPCRVRATLTRNPRADTRRAGTNPASVERRTNAA